MMIAIDYWKKISKYYYILGNRNFTKPNKNVYSKIETYKFLKRNNLNYIETWKFKDNVARSLILKEFNFIIKPNTKDYTQSFYKKNSKYKAYKISCKKDYVNFKNKKFYFNNLIIQKYIQTSSKNDELPVYIYVTKSGRALNIIGALKEEVYPKKFGTAIALSLRDATHLNKEIQRIVKKLNWRGPLMIEFIYDRKEKIWKIIEFNGRPWLMNDFFRKMNFNFLSLLSDDLNNKQIKDNNFNKKTLKKKKSLNIILKECLKIKKKK